MQLMLTTLPLAGLFAPASVHSFGYGIHRGLKASKTAKNSQKWLFFVIFGAFFAAWAVIMDAYTKLAF